MVLERNDSSPVHRCTVVVINGQGFTCPILAVLIGGSPATVIPGGCTATQLIVTPLVPLAAGTTFQVVLTTGTIGNPVTLTAFVGLGLPGPAGPQGPAGPACPGPICLTVDCKRKTVTFGSTAATSFTVVSNTVINAVVPPGPSAAAPTPIVTGPSPASGPVSGGNTVTLTGSNLNGATAVTFAGNAASSFAVAPAGTAGTASVTPPASTSLGFNYTYIAPPAPTEVFPTTGVTSGGDSFAITGTGLTGTTSVNFGTTPATSFTEFHHSNFWTDYGGHGGDHYWAGLIDTIDVNFGTTAATGVTVTPGRREDVWTVVWSSLHLVGEFQLGRFTRI
ncbi:hypothetical protein VC83_01567 [Pseudogymnoascus destructans]|uniref:IPT/TIG domain-containing protein n=1 Tax=Pseudogymnoascus destructans TaxID=655981 RepID=A0A177AIP8_9PEZI|nr:uncharacterized protein VC83_01567 [Pseudogymnoascus destructans]OAF61947.2 hypothetical protein VC83_01567 [Pseudogymnoascus destructans]